MSSRNTWRLAVAAALLMLGVGEARLNGNETAAKRIGQRTTRDARINIWAAVAGQMSNNCVGLYERWVLDAYHEYESCLAVLTLKTCTR